jgi:membrane protein
MIPEKESRARYSQILEGHFDRINRRAFGIPGIIRYGIERFTDMRGVEGSASIAFFTVFGLPPLLIVIVTVASYYLEIPDVQALLIQIVEDNIPIPADIIINFMNEILKQRGAVGIIGLIGFAWAASGVLMTLSANINRAWPTAKHRNVIERRLIAFLMIFSFVFFIVLTSILSTAVTFLSQIQLPGLPIDPSLGFLSDWLLFFLRFVLFFALYFFVPKTKVKKRAAFWGAVFASLAWEITSFGFNWYFQSGLANYNVLYGSLGTLVAIMFWIYLDCIILVIGAYLSAAVVNHNSLDNHMKSEKRTTFSR